MSAAFNAIMRSETKESLAKLYLAQLGVQRELVGVLKVLLGRGEEDLESFLDCNTRALPDGEPDFATLDLEARKVVDEYEAVIAQAHTALAKAGAL